MRSVAMPRLMVLGWVLAGGLSGMGAAEDVGQKFQIRQGSSPEEVVKLVGEPAAKFKDGDEDNWLYDNAVREKNGERRCPELLFRKGRFIQTNWMPETSMKKSVEVVKAFGDWQPPAEVQLKSFVMRDTGVVGKSKDEVVKKLGQPDVKKVFNGKEVWVYRMVRMAADKEQKISAYLTFEDGKVTESTGN